jgi:hypothetical protein
MKRQRTIDVQIYYWVKTLFDPTFPEIKQFEGRVKAHPELAIYTEFVLYLFHTRSRSPIVTWSKVEDNVTHHENQLICQNHDQPMTAVKERLKTLIEECRSVDLLPWEVMVCKVYHYAVKANSKRGVEYLDKEVLNFLSHAQDGNAVHTPDIDA